MKSKEAFIQVRAFVYDNTDKGPFHIHDFPFEGLNPDISIHHVYRSLKKMVDDGIAEYVQKGRLKYVQATTMEKKTEYTAEEIAIISKVETDPEDLMGAPDIFDAEPIEALADVISGDAFKDDDISDIIDSDEDCIADKNQSDLEGLLDIID